MSPVVVVAVETKLASKMRCSVPRHLRAITRSREGGVASAGGPSPSVRTTAPNVGVVCLKWVHALWLSVYAYTVLILLSVLRTETSLLDHHCPWMGAKCIVCRCLPLLNQRDTPAAP